MSQSENQSEINRRDFLKTSLVASVAATTVDIADLIPPSDGCFVAQVSNLLYRRLPVGRPSAKPKSFGMGEPCGLETRDTADRNVCPTTQAGADYEISGLNDRLTC